MTAPASPSTGHDARALSVRVKRRLRLTLKGVHQRLLPSSLRLCVFVAGMQRSGTNLLMEILDESHATQVFHETDPRAFANYQMRERAVIRELASQCPAPVMVVKALCEMDLLGDLMDEFAPAKSIWVVRDWRDSAASAIRSFGNFVPQWQRLARGHDARDWRSRGMSQATRDLLGSLYREGATDYEGAAIMWYYRNILFFERALDRDARVRLLFYEDLLEDPAVHMRSIWSFLGFANGSAPAPARGIRRRSPRAVDAPALAEGVRDACDALLGRLRDAARGAA